MSDKLTIEVSKEWGGIQLSINQVDEKGAGGGYRISGPKFTGGSELIVSHTLTSRDATEIRAYLDALFPVCGDVCPDPDRRLLCHQEPGHSGDHRKGTRVWSANHTTVVAVPNERSEP